MYITIATVVVIVVINTSPPGQNGRHFDIFWHIFVNKNVRSWIQISLKFVLNGPIDNKPAMVQVMAWRRTGDKPLPEAMLTRFNDAYMWHKGRWVNIIVIDEMWVIDNLIAKWNIAI